MTELIGIQEFVNDFRNGTRGNGLAVKVNDPLRKNNCWHLEEERRCHLTTIFVLFIIE